jgi:(1->4)-alpha-D-glucan 1-alpha-D-glucosylmutase
VTPRATYRLQLQPAFGFSDAAAIASYLADLGVSHVYSSPYLQATPGSLHGYDVVDHGRVNDELGGPAAHADMARAFGEARLGQVLDIVPNHMAIGPDNAWWWDVLENGPSSVYAAYFDVDWDPPESQLRNLVLVPVLGDHYGRVLEDGDLRVVREGGRFVVEYYEQRFPVAPRSLDTLVGAAAERTGSDDLAFLANAFGALPIASSLDPDDTRRRHRDKEVLARLLDELLARDVRLANAVDEVVDELNADPDRLDALLSRQNYRLARWQLGTHQLDYRRFFDVTGLAGLRTEDERVFHDVHELVLGWLRTGMLDGVRVDHIDGLRDPTAYLERLTGSARDAWIVVEKILAATEPLPDWPIAGTTGYEFMARVTGLLTDPDGEQPLTELYSEITGLDAPWDDVRRAAKREVLERVLAADLARLTNLFMAVCVHHRRHRDYSRAELSAVLAEVLVEFPVYRTYARRRADGSAQLSASDRAVIDSAIDAVAERAQDTDPELLALLRSILRLEFDGDDATELCVAFQQLSGPTMAKGVEDTAFYRYNRFVAHNDVGGDPGQFAVAPAEFHHANELVARQWPDTMLTTSTHDTKRSEDVRARLAVLSEIPGRWGEVVRGWVARNERHRPRSSTGSLPDRNTEYLLYQTLVGAHPIEADRVQQFVLKAVREAKVHTSWLAPDADYESALATFVESLLGDREFVGEVAAFVDEIRVPAQTNSLAQTLWKLTAPGVPDIYQGCELWDLSLVDPDNRRAVDYDLRRRLLGEVQALTPAAVLARHAEGLPKLHLVRRALQVRAERPAAFGPGSSYRAIPADGPAAHHVVAYERGEQVVAVAPRLSARCGGRWDGTALALPSGAWIDVLSDRRYRGPSVDVDDLLADFPVALLVRSHDEGARADHGDDGDDGDDA